MDWRILGAAVAGLAIFWLALIALLWVLRPRDVRLGAPGGPGPDQDQDRDVFWPARAIPFFVAIAWLAVGIRQWIRLNKWTKKYETYRELQRKIDEKLADEKNSDEEKKPPGQA